MGLDFRKLTGFEWDDGNALKNPAKHAITNEEAEAVFLASPVVADAARPEEKEPRWFALGEVPAGRVLRVVFTVRGTKICVISARKACLKESINYEKIRSTR